jgi:transmembrane sensor
MTDHTSADLPVPDWEALARHIAGESEGAERARLESFLQANPADAELVRAVTALTQNMPASPSANLDVEAALAKTKARRTAPTVIPLASRRGGRGRPIVRWAGLAAAAAAVILFTRDGDSRPDSGAAATDVVYRGTLGKVDSVRLADGSTAILAPGAELTVPVGFPSESRSVRLTGQGWFRAEHAGAHAFTVLAGDAVVRDIGTVFSVRPGVNGEVRVAVHEGAVAVRGTADGEIQLSQGDEVTLVAGAMQTPLRGSVRAEDADWTSGHLHFRDVSMEEFSRTVASWTGWVVRLEDPELRVLRVTQDLTLAMARQRMEEAALVLGARVEWKGDTAVVSRGGSR